MTKRDFLRRLEDILETDEGSIKSEDALTNLKGWDSLAILVFMSMVDEEFGVTLSPQNLARSRTVEDLMHLLGNKLN